MGMSAAATRPDLPIGFTDGSTRPVFRDQADGRQYVPDDDGQPSYGTWIYPDQDQAAVPEADVPFIRETRPSR